MSGPPDIGRGQWLAMFSSSEAGAGRLTCRSSGAAGVDGRGPSRTASRVTAASLELLFEGVLFDREVLGRQLGDRLREGAGDGRLVLEAYRHWGVEAFARLRGTVCGCLWDPARQTLLAFRDPAGTHPLFFARVGRALLFSPSIEVLLRQPEVSLDLNRLAVADYLYSRNPQFDETFFTAVRRVPPGHLLRSTGNEICLERYWDPVGGVEIDWSCERDLEQFEVLLVQSVERSLRLGRPAVFLSGGLDSSVVASTAAEVARERSLPGPFALSYRIPEPEWPEVAIQDGLAAALDLPHSSVTFDQAVGPQGMLLSSLQLGRTRPAPLMNCFLPAFIHLASAGRQRGCEVILTGDGGDEWFRFFPRIAADLIRSGNLTNLHALARSMSSPYRPASAGAVASWLWNDGLRPLLATAKNDLRKALFPVAARTTFEQRFFARLPSWLAPDPGIRREMFERHLARVERQTRSGRSFYRRAVHEVLEQAQTSMGMELVFDEGRRLGVEFSSPLWDPDLVAFLVRTPFHLRNAEGRPKGLFRRSLHSRFPQLGFDKQPKFTPVRFFTGRLFEEAGRLWPNYRGLEGLASLGVVDRDAVAGLVSSALSNNESTAAEANFVWQLLSFESWLHARLNPQAAPGQIIERGG